jgi:Zn finger protein HypA/HybF involved in hydrogenase expression
MATLQIQRPRKSVYTRGMIACRKCAAPIYIYKLNAMPDEFSVQCPKCRDRSIYFKQAVVLQDLPERRRKPRR